MPKDIYQTPITIEIDKKNYSLEFNHASYATFEKTTNRSIFEIYEEIIDGKKTKLSDIPILIKCALLKHHNEEDILELKNKILESPWIWQSLEIQIYNAFITPLVPPKILKEIAPTNKKKQKKQPPKNKNMNG